MADDDSPPVLTEQELAQMRPLQELRPDVYERITRGKTRITINLDDEVLAVFRERAEAQGRGYQTLINEALRGYLGQGKGRALDEETLRRVLREELDSRG
jgi:uncharacterized protein (DUF4415 family)